MRFTDDTFGVNIIPHTASVTALRLAAGPGDAVNIEIDMARPATLRGWRSSNDAEP